MRLLDGLRKDLSEREKDLRRREQDLQRREQEWLVRVYDRHAALDTSLAQRREENDRELRKEKAALDAEKEQWRVQLRHEMDMFQQQKDGFHREKLRFIQQQTESRVSTFTNINVNRTPSP